LDAVKKWRCFELEAGREIIIVLVIRFYSFFNNLSLVSYLKTPITTKASENIYHVQ
jgi:hypothetical protein